MPAEHEPIRIITFAGLSNLPLLAAETLGLFKKHGVASRIVYAANSNEQRHGLADGHYDVAIGAVDNAVAQVDRENVDAVIVCGGDGGLNQLFVRADIATIEDIRGKAVAVDAPVTAYALLLYKMLQSKGLRRDVDYRVVPAGSTRHRLEAMEKQDDVVAAMLTPPYSIEAVKDGKVRSLGPPQQLIGPYQGNGAWVKRAWATSNAAQLEALLRALIEGARWSLDVRNRASVVALLADRMKINAHLAADCYEQALSPETGGITVDLDLDAEGFANVLALRAEFAPASDARCDAAKYLDMSYYSNALNALN